MRGPLFTAADGLELTQNVTSLTEAGTAEAIARLLNRVFNGAIGMAEHDDDSPSPNELKKYYNGVIARARALAEALELPTDPSELLTQEAGHKPQLLPQLSRPLQAPKSLDWLARGANPPGIVAVAEGTGGNARPRVPGLPAKFPLIAKPASAAAGGDDFWKLAAIAEEAASLPELAMQLAWLDSLGIRAPDTMDELRGSEAIKVCLAVVPHVLALIIGLSERAKRVPRPIPDKTNYQRTFFRELFLGLADVHHTIFGCAPRLQNSERDPAGSGVIWVRKILKLAAQRIEGNLIDGLRCDQDGRVSAVYAVKIVAGLSDWTIADRLREGARLREKLRGIELNRRESSPMSPD